MGDLMPPNDRANRYDHTPRKVFDKAMDRMDLKRQRDREDSRSDLRAVLARIVSIEDKLIQVLEQLGELEQHVAQHCNAMALDDDPGHMDPTEELE